MNRTFYRLPAGCLALLLSARVLAAESAESALEEGKIRGDVRLRFESVEQDSSLEDAEALTVRMRLGYDSAAIAGWSAYVEMEHVQPVAGVADYSLPVTGLNADEYAVIADPETTELDQAYLRYQRGPLSLQAGRQLITFDDHRFVGHVGWRQDRQTFDAFSAGYQGGKRFSLAYSYIGQRNRIFAEAADQDSSDHLVNAKVNTALGELVGFAYLLETDEEESTVQDTYGLRFAGRPSAGDLTFSYTLAFATQEAELGSATFETNYLFAEAGLALPLVNFAVSQERLGSDDGQYGFATPLATLHKFNGWADVFLTTPAAGLVDSYLSIGGGLGKSKWALAWHDFEAEEDRATARELGRELDLEISRPFTSTLSAGFKYAAYQAAKRTEGLVDSRKFWLWVDLRF